MCRIVELLGLNKHFTKYGSNYWLTFDSVVTNTHTNYLLLVSLLAHVLCIVQ